MGFVQFLLYCTCRSVSLLYAWHVLYITINIHVTLQYSRYWFYGGQLLTKVKPWNCCKVGNFQSLDGLHMWYMSIHAQDHFCKVLLLYKLLSALFIYIFIRGVRNEVKFGIWYKKIKDYVRVYWTKEWTFISTIKFKYQIRHYFLFKCWENIQLANSTFRHVSALMWCQGCNHNIPVVNCTKRHPSYCMWLPCFYWILETTRILVEVKG